MNQQVFLMHSNTCNTRLPPSKKISGETELSTLLNEALVQLNELHRTIRYRSHQLHPDTEALERVEKRISVLHQLARKHQVTPEELPNVLHNIDQEIQSLTTNETTLLALNSERLIIESEYQQLTKELSEKRKKSSDRSRNTCHATYSATRDVNGSIHHSVQQTFPRNNFQRWRRKSRISIAS
ncbi:MAG: hypothetical protein LRY43_03790 [Gammaproteobacteria bacterium]|nr:hypothetical protein [Gammaproteobacteria bacterium]